MIICLKGRWDENVCHVRVLVYLLDLDYFIVQVLFQKRNIFSKVLLRIEAIYHFRIMENLWEIFPSFVVGEIKLLLVLTLVFCMVIVTGIVGIVIILILKDRIGDIWSMCNSVIGSSRCLCHWLLYIGVVTTIHVFF